MGRPAFVYRLTEQGDALYPKLYDSLANVLLSELRTIAGADALQKVLRLVATRFAEPYMGRVEGKPLAERVAETAHILQERGCLADCSTHDGDWYVSQYTCPFPSVARSNSSVCAMEVEFVRRLTGADARLVSSLLRGDRSCTYRIRATGAAERGFPGGLALFGRRFSPGRFFPKVMSPPLGPPAEECYNPVSL